MGSSVGYAMQTSGYRVWVLVENRIEETKNVHFNKTLSPRIQIDRTYKKKK